MHFSKSFAWLLLFISPTVAGRPASGPVVPLVGNFAFIERLPIFSTKLIIVDLTFVLR
jgi:hypothetical protein